MEETREGGREEEETPVKGVTELVMERQGRIGKKQGSESAAGGSLEERIRGRQRGEGLLSDHPASPCPSLL